MHVKHPWLPLICCLTAVTALAACGDATPAAVHHAAGGSGGAAGGTAGGSNQAGASQGGSSNGGSTAIAGTGGTSAGGTSSGGTAGTVATAGTSTGGTGGDTIGGGGTGGNATGGGGTGGSAPVCPAPAATHSATACTRSCWATAASDCANYVDWGLLNPPVNAVDGDPATRFSTGVPQMTPATYQIDLGSAVSVDGIKLDSGTDPTDFAQAYEIDVSLDANTWTPVACGAGTTVTDVAFAPTTARYIKVIQNVVSSGSWWSVHEINVYCPTTDTCGPDTGGGGTGGTGGTGGAGTGGGGVSGGGTGGDATGGAGTGGDTGGAGTGGGGASSGGASGAGTGGGGASSGGASGAGTGGGGTGGASTLVSTAPTGGLDKCVTVHHH